ncbi:MAG: hypothetical protein ACRC41_00765 [Sarcina sp.]
MSEPGYGSSIEISNLLGGNNKKILSYLVGSSSNESNIRGNMISNFLNKFKLSAKNLLVAFTDESILLSELERGNSLDRNSILSYKQIKKFNYYTKSSNLEIITDTNNKYFIKVSRYDLEQSIKCLSKVFQLKYID